MESKNDLLRSLPKVDELIEKLLQSMSLNTPYLLIKKLVQESIECERMKILADYQVYTELTEKEWLNQVLRRIAEKIRPKLRKIINGTGVVIHTNLGRSVLSSDATAKIAMAAASYTNLEFDLDTGKRGSRYSLVEEIICDITGAEAALVVNNNAAAVLICLDTLAKGTEVIVSRGQLVEIGGSFRIPDVMTKSGATLTEVGATNRTHLYDYERAITENTSMLLRVHTSNFKIIGFTSDISAQEMVELARKKSLITMEDLGSGCLIDLSMFGFPKEPTVQEIVKAGVDVVTFSGDKLLGGPQAGIIVGNRQTINRIKNNPLNRALRIDKFTLASLESTLREYYQVDNALSNIPTLSMLTVSADELKVKAQKIHCQLNRTISEKAELNVVPVSSRVGGGALPEHGLDSWAVDLDPISISVMQFEQKLRSLDVPVVGRIENDHFLLDVRTILDSQIPELVQSLTQALICGEGDD